MAGEVKVEGLAGFRKELRKLESDTNWNLELTRGMRAIAHKAAGWSQDAAVAMGGQQAHFADALFGRATTNQARIEVAGDRTAAGKARANPAFWGTKAQDNWIGTSWDVGDPTTGPYAINAAIFQHGNDILDEVRDLIEEITRQAFDD